MAITAEDIQNQTFSIDRRGYNVDEMDVFLERVAQEIDDLNNENAALNSENAALKEQIFELQQREEEEPIYAPAPEPETIIVNELTPMQQADIAAKEARIADLEAQLEERSRNDSAISQALIIAQRTGEEIIARSKNDADQIRRDAEEEARRILDKAAAEKQRVVENINDLNESREQIRVQYQDLLHEFIASATTTLCEIGGEATETFVVPEASVFEPAVNEPVQQKAPAPANQSNWQQTSAAATYTTPTIGNAVPHVTTPKPSASSKDLSGYGASDDSFSFDEID